MLFVDIFFYQLHQTVEATFIIALVGRPYRLKHGCLSSVLSVDLLNWRLINIFVAASLVGLRQTFLSHGNDGLLSDRLWVVFRILAFKVDQYRHVYHSGLDRLHLLCAITSFDSLSKYGYPVIWLGR